MKLKMKLMAAAVALTVSAGANAAFDNFTTGNSSLTFIALDSSTALTNGGNANRASTILDLDFNLNSFLAGAALTSTPGTIQWDFANNTLKINNVVQTGGNYNWSSAFASFNSAAALSQTKWGVIAGDTSADGGINLLRLATTSAQNTTAANWQGEDIGVLYGVGDNLFSFANSNLNGDGSTALLSTSVNYVGTTTNFGTAGRWQLKTLTSAYNNVGADKSAFYMLDDSTHVASPNVTTYAGTFNYNAGVLTYSVAAVPEPSEYALMLAGLGMIGFMARRRLNNRA